MVLQIKDRRLRILVFPVCLVFGALAMHAQVPPATGEASADPMAALRAFDGGDDQPYTLGRGDQLMVDASGRPEISGKHTIGPDGEITLPIIGSVKLTGRTREEAAAIIKTELDKYYENLTVVVGVDVYSSNHVSVLGAVERPGLITFDQPPTILEVMARAGASPFPTAGTGVILGKPMSLPERCAIYRGSQSVMWIDLRKLVESGGPLLQIRLKRDDVIFVPSANERYVSMLGEVLHPGLLQLEQKTNLAQLLAEVGGITDKAGRYPVIQIIPGDGGTVHTVSYKDFLQGKAIDLTLKSGDIIYVPESKFDRASIALQKISPLISIATVGGLLVQR